MSFVVPNYTFEYLILVKIKLTCVPDCKLHSFPSYFQLFDLEINTYDVIQIRPMPER